MAWSELEPDQDLVEGQARILGLDRALGRFDADSLFTDERKKAARALLSRRLFDPRGANFTQIIPHYGSRTLLLDAAADSAALADDLADLYALAFIIVAAGDKQQSSAGLMVDIMARAEAELVSAARAFGALAPYALGQSSSTTRPSGGALVTIIDTHS